LTGQADADDETFSGRQTMSPLLGRLVIYTAKIDRMAEFYARHFGYSIMRSPTDRIVELRPTGSGIALLLHPAASGQKEGQVLVKLVFDVKDVPEFCAAARKKGLNFGKVHQADGYAFANAKDPSKNSVQVSSRAFKTR
jgi:predicted enzyme related to lactoylglutathione lyase